MEGANYSRESITPNANEEIIYPSISTKLFTLSPCICVCVCVPCAFGPLIAEGGGDKPAREKCVGKLNNKLFTSFISHACSSLVNTFKSICHPHSHSPRSDLPFCLAPLFFACRQRQRGLLYLGTKRDRTSWREGS